MNQYELLANFTRYGSKLFSLSSGEFAYLTTLISYTTFSNEVYPSRETIQEGCGLGRGAQYTNHQSLEKKGLLYSTNKPMGDFNKHNQYHINFELIKETLIKHFAELAAMNAASINLSGEDLFAVAEVTESEVFQEEVDIFETGAEPEQEVFTPEEPLEIESPVVTPTHKDETVIKLASRRGLYSWMKETGFSMDNQDFARVSKELNDCGKSLFTDILFIAD